MTNNKRRFKRIPFPATATLVLNDETNHAVNGQVVDLSLKGALLEIEQPTEGLHHEDVGELTITPTSGEFTIQFHVSVAYLLHQKRLIGLDVLSLDIDSAAHLRRLVELNLGNSNDLQRELSHLIGAK